MAQLFRVPQKIHHGLLLVAELAPLYRGGKALALEDVALAAGLSQGFLEQVAAPLRRAGIIAGQRGPRGGYRLTRDPRCVTVREVFDALEGPTSVVACTGETAYCGLSARCSSRQLWSAIQDNLDSILGRMTLADVIKRAKPSRCRPKRAKRT